MVLDFLKDKVDLYVREIILKPEDSQVLAKVQFLGRKKLKEINGHYLLTFNLFWLLFRYEEMPVIIIPFRFRF